MLTAGMPARSSTIPSAKLAALHEPLGGHAHFQILRRKSALRQTHDEVLMSSGMSISLDSAQLMAMCRGDNIPVR
jgi:hypothetical protein